MQKVKGFLHHIFYSRFNGHYRKKLILILLLASLPGIVIGLVMFVVSKTHIEKEMKNIHENDLYDTMQMIKDQFSHVEMFLAHWAFDPSFKESYQDIDFVYKYKEVHDIYQSLLVMEGSNHLIDRVELFLNKPNPMIITKDRYKHLTNKDQIETYTDFLNRKRSLFWESSSLNDETRFSSLRLVHTIPGGFEEPYGAVVALFNKDKMANLLKSPYEQGTTFLITDQQQWIFGNRSKTSPSNMDQAIFNEIKTSTNKTGTFLFDWDKVTYSITFDTFSRLGKTWFIVSAAPLSTITAPVILISKLIIGVSILIIIIAIMLSIIASKKLYSPIETLVKKLSNEMLEEKTPKLQNEFEIIETQWNSLSRESTHLKTQLENQLPHMREGFLLQLIHGYLFTLKEPEIRKRMEQYGWNLQGKRFMTIFIQLFGFTKLEEKHSKEDEGIFTFMAANVVEEVVGESAFEGNVINFHDLSLGLFILLPDDWDQEERDKKITTLCQTIINKINHATQMDVSICISRVTDTVKTIPSLFEETKISLSFRSLQERNQMIEIEKLDTLKHSVHFEYPFEMEREITHAIRLRMVEDAVTLLHQFVLHLSSKNEAVMKQGMFQLLGKMIEVGVQSNVTPNASIEGATLYEQLAQLREPNEVEAWFREKVIIPLIEELSQKKDERIRQLVEKVMVIMDENYMEEISLDSCADHVNLNPAVLSKVFKEYTGVNFIDYLTDIRLKKAKELLAETDMKIADIAELIGYKHSYFNRLFKKHEGYTPGQYREQSRENAS